MSIKLMTKAWELDLKSNEKLVLIAMADHANDDGDCYPSVTKMAVKCGMTRQGVIGIINRLISYGYVKKESRLRDNGSQTSNLYTLDLDGVNTVDSVNEVDMGCKRPLQGGVNEVDRGCKRPLPLESSINHQEEPSVNHNPLPLCIDPTVWAEWVQHRKEIKKPLTPTTIKKQIAQLEKFDKLGMDTTEIINASISAGYVGLFALRHGKKYEAPKSKMDVTMDTYERAQQQKREMEQRQNVIEGELA
jgi:hypothetical protein